MGLSFPACQEFTLYIAQGKYQAIEQSLVTIFTKVLLLFVRGVIVGCASATAVMGLQLPPAMEPPTPTNFVLFYIVQGK